MVRLGDIADPEVGSNDTIPEGWYKVIIDPRSSVKVGKESNKSYASLWYVINKGECKGRILFDNKSYQTSSIQFLKPLMKALEKPDDYEIVVDAAGDFTIPIEEFVSKQIMVYLTYWKNKSTGAKDPKIVAYKSLAEAGETEEAPF